MEETDKNILPKLTETALNQVKSILKNENPNSFVKLSVDGGGCSGFSYKFSIENKMNKDDLIIKFADNKNVLFSIDADSLLFLKDSVIDWKESLSGSMFEIKNPSAKSSCGCGTSFSI